MSRRLLSAVLSFAFLSPVVAHADDFTFVPNNSALTYQFSLDASSGASFNSGGLTGYAFGTADGSTSLYLLDSSSSNYLDALGYGQVDAELVDNTNGFAYLLVGPQLFTTDGQNLSFVDQSYSLAAITGSDFGTQLGGSLDITAQTPEPSSLALLGTGILSMAGVARRRLMGA